MPTTSDRPRAAAAVLRKEGAAILLVKHRWRDGTTSWILPGGGLLPGETPEQAALRELYEETGLQGKIVRYLFTMPYDLGTSAAFLVEVDADAQVALGTDPEETQEGHRMLEDVAWFPIQDVRDHPEVQRVLAIVQWPGADQGGERESPRGAFHLPPE